MVGQNVLLELVEGDKVQLYVYTSAGITDHKNSHYTQFIGCLLRPSVDTLATIMRRLGSSEAMDDDVSVADDASLRGGKGGGAKEEGSATGMQALWGVDLEEEGPSRGFCPPVLLLFNKLLQVRNCTSGQKI